MLKARPEAVVFLYDWHSQASDVLRLTERQLDAISYDLTLPSLRILLRADLLLSKS